MSLQRIINWLLPREDHFFTYLERQANVARQAVAVFAKVGEESSDSDAIRVDVDRLEKEGDKIVMDLLEALSATFVTPIDREDLQRLSKRLDDVLDLVNVTARSFVIFGVKRPSPPMLELIRLLQEATTILDEIMPSLGKKQYDPLIRGCQRIHELEKQADRTFREELSRLFHDPSVEAKDILRAREVLDHLETAVDRCDQVAEVLTNVAVKHA